MLLPSRSAQRLHGLNGFPCRASDHQSQHKTPRFSVREQSFTADRTKDDSFVVPGTKGLAKRVAAIPGLQPPE